MTAETIPVDVLALARNVVSGIAADAGMPRRSNAVMLGDMDGGPEINAAIRAILADRSTRPAEPAPIAPWYSFEVRSWSTDDYGMVVWSDWRQDVSRTRPPEGEHIRHVVALMPAGPAPEVVVGDGEVVAWLAEDDPEDMSVTLSAASAKKWIAYALKVSPLTRLSALEAERAKTAAAQDLVRGLTAGLEEWQATAKQALSDEVAAKAEADELRRERDEARALVTSSEQGRYRSCGELLIRAEAAEALLGKEAAERKIAEVALSSALQERDEAREYGGSVRIENNKLKSEVVHYKDLADALRLDRDEAVRLLDRLVKAFGKARLALAGYFSADQAAFELDVAMPSIADRARLRGDQRDEDGAEV